MKTYKYLFLLIGLSIIGCSDLEENPISQLSPESYFSSLSIEQVEGFTSGAYAHMVHRNFLSREMAQTIEFRSDMTAIGRTSAQERVDNDNLTTSADNAAIAGSSNSYWPKAYQVIGAANQAVKAGKSLVEGGDDSAELKEVIARARFARAFTYFHLVRQFGPIPYLDDTTPLSEAVVMQRTPVDEVYVKIIEDLEYCKTWLPKTQVSRALPAKAAASSYLALVYLTMAGTSDNAYFQKAYDEAKGVINNTGGNYPGLDLEPDFQDLFNPAKQDASMEPIFVLDFTGIVDGDQGRDYQGAFTGIRSDAQYTNASGGASGGGWSVQVPTLKVFTTWNKADYRRGVTFDTIAKKSNGTIYHYTQFTTLDVANGLNRPHIAKYTRMANGTSSEGNHRGSKSNYIMMRFAEVLLIGAEAANEIGQTGDAMLWANRVMARSRAGGVIKGGLNDGKVFNPSAVPADFTGLTKDAFRTRILDERRLELAFEFSRWYDICRRKLGDTVFGPNGYEADVSNESGVGPGPKSWDPSQDYLLPIPISEILINPNLLPQNSGY